MPGLEARRRPPPQALQLRGFNCERAVFLLTARSDSAAAAAPPAVLERDFADLQAWDRLLRRAKTSSDKAGPSDRDAFQRLPTRRFKKLAARSWVRGDTASGWRIELQKNAATCEAWLTDAFSRLPAALQTTFLDDKLYATAKHEQAARRAESRRAKDLQQYFSSPRLVQFVLEKVLAFVETHEIGRREEIVWLEPSCGDGRMLAALLRTGARCITGYEIDERLHGIASQTVQEAAEADRTCSGPAARTDVEVHCGDFLTSTSSASKGQVVVAVGNPPFGVKGDDGRDLVHRFVRHSAQEWRARVIAFVVPERCARASFVETALQLAGGDDGNAHGWELALQESLAGFEFHFGRGEQLKSVKQPSVLQLFRRP